jgi:hypothetical protein
MAGARAIGDNKQVAWLLGTDHLKRLAGVTRTIKDNISNRCLEHWNEAEKRTG